MYKSKKMEDFGKMNEKERLAQEKKLKKEVKEIFKKYLDSTSPFESLQQAKSSEENVKTFQAIKYNTEDTAFCKFINALLDKDLANYYTYALAFNLNGGNSFFGYSALIDALMEIDEYTIPVEISKKYKTYITYYLHVNRMNLSKSRFDDFKYLSKRVNWPNLINHSIHYGNFGNDVSSGIISASILNMFLKRTGTVYYKSAGYEELLTIISYGLFDSVKLLDRIAHGDKSLNVSDQMITFLREYCINVYETKEERYRELHSQYALKYLPHITIHGFEEFYWFLRNNVSDETRLLLALK